MSVMDTYLMNCLLFPTLQPLLSAALLDRLIHHDRNIPPEYTSPENYNEIQVLINNNHLVSLHALWAY